MRMVQVVLVLMLMSCKNKDNRLREPDMNLEKLSLNDTITNQVNVFLADFLNNRDSSKLASVVTPDFARFMNGIKVASNASELNASLNVFYTGFPDMHISKSSNYIKDNQVFVQWVFTGTNTGEFGEVPATGKKVKILGLSQLHFNEMGKMYQEDVFYNELDLLQQLGYTLKPPVME